MHNLLKLYYDWSGYTAYKIEVYVSSSQNSGSSWSTPVRVSPGTGFHHDPKLATDNTGQVHVVWYKDDTTPGVIYKRSSNNGSTWTSGTTLSNPSIASRNPDITASGSNLYAVWQAGTVNNYEIYFKYSTNNGSTWSAIKKISTSGNSTSPAIAIDSIGNIVIIWMQKVSDKYQIFISRSIDGGTTWTIPTNITSSFTSKDIKYPAILIDPSCNLNAFWEDNVSGNYEIYFHGSSR